MTSVRKRKMARSSVKKNTKRVKDKQKRVVITGHPLIAKYWDHKLTVQKNYKKLGLTVSLAKDKGGKELKLETISERRARELQDESEKESDGNDEVPHQQKLSLGSMAVETDPLKILVGEARIIRDPQSNEIMEVIHGKMQSVVKGTEGEDDEPAYSIVDELKQYNEAHAKPARVVLPTEQEQHWLSRLDAKYGDDFEKMKWDHKLNPLFMSVGQLNRKMGQWKRANGME